MAWEFRGTIKKILQKSIDYISTLYKVEKKNVIIFVCSDDDGDAYFRAAVNQKIIDEVFSIVTIQGKIATFDPMVPLALKGMKEIMFPMIAEDYKIELCCVQVMVFTETQQWSKKEYNDSGEVLENKDLNYVISDSKKPVQKVTLEYLLQKEE